MTTKDRSKQLQEEQLTERNRSLSARGEVEQNPAGRLRHVLHLYDRQLTLSSIHYWYWETVQACHFWGGQGIND